METDRIITLPATQRAIIIGNSGSGKTWVAQQLSDVLGQTAIDLGQVHWVQLPNEKRDKKEAHELVTVATNAQTWILEGVYGWLVQPILSRATCLIWLDICWEECRRNLHSRQKVGLETESFRNLLIWASEYETRQTSSSLAGHKTIFEEFNRTKIRLRKREDVDRLLLSIVELSP